MSDTVTGPDLQSEMNKLKKHIFYEMLNLAGRVFILVRHADDVMIGRRGFMPEEKEKGIVLVLNSRMNFTWDDEGVSVKLVFGTIPEQCFIPAHRIISVFSPELNAQFSIATEGLEKTTSSGDSAKKKRPAQEKTPAVGNIIPVDFKRKK